MFHASFASNESFSHWSVQGNTKYLIISEAEQKILDNIPGWTKKTVNKENVSALSLEKNTDCAEENESLQRSASKAARSKQITPCKRTLPSPCKSISNVELRRSRRNSGGEADRSVGNDWPLTTLQRSRSLSDVSSDNPLALSQVIQNVLPTSQSADEVQLSVDRENERLKLLSNVTESCEQVPSLNLEKRDALSANVEKTPIKLRASPRIAMKYKKPYELDSDVVSILNNIKSRIKSPMKGTRQSITAGEVEIDVKGVSQGNSSPLRRSSRLCGVKQIHKKTEEIAKKLLSPIKDVEDEDQDVIRVVEEDKEIIRVVEEDEEVIRVVEEDEDVIRVVEEDEEVKRVVEEDEDIRVVEEDPEVTKVVEEDQEVTKVVEEDQGVVSKDQEVIRVEKDHEAIQVIAEEQEVIKVVEEDQEVLRVIEKDQKTIRDDDLTLVKQPNKKQKTSLHAEEHAKSSNKLKCMPKTNSSVNEVGAACPKTGDSEFMEIDISGEPSPAKSVIICDSPAKATLTPVKVFDVYTQYDRDVVKTTDLSPHHDNSNNECIPSSLQELFSPSKHSTPYITDENLNCEVKNASEVTPNKASAVENVLQNVTSPDLSVPHTPNAASEIAIADERNSISSQPDNDPDELPDTNTDLNSSRFFLCCENIPMSQIPPEILPMKAVSQASEMNTIEPETMDLQVQHKIVPLQMSHEVESLEMQCKVGTLQIQPEAVVLQIQPEIIPLHMRTETALLQVPLETVTSQALPDMPMQVQHELSKPKEILPQQVQLEDIISQTKVTPPSHIETEMTSSPIQHEMASSHIQPEMASSHIQPEMASSHIQPEMASSHIQPEMASSHIQPEIATSHIQPVSLPVLVPLATSTPPEVLQSEVNQDDTPAPLLPKHLFTIGPGFTKSCDSIPCGQAQKASTFIGSQVSGHVSSPTILCADTASRSVNVSPIAGCSHKQDPEAKTLAARKKLVFQKDLVPAGVVPKVTNQRKRKMSSRNDANRPGKRARLTTIDFTQQEVASMVTMIRELFP